MDRKNLTIAGGLICGIIVLSVIGVFIAMHGIAETLKGDSTYSDSIFNNSTPQTTAVSIARLNLGTGGFESNPVKSVHLTSDGKYWIVETYNSFYRDQVLVMTIDAETLKSKVDNGGWKSLDELKAAYIAGIQSDYSSGKPQKITTNGREIWRVPNYHEVIYENGSVTHETTYIYVDLKTGRSKNTWSEFNRAAGTDGWLTLKEVDAAIGKMDIGPILTPSGDALRNLYPE